MTQRFTIDGSEKLESGLAHLCDKTRDGVLSLIPSRKVHALLLGGGYGRGEGGVLRLASGDAPYNDLEFYLLLYGPDLLTCNRYNTSIAQLAETLTHIAGVEVEFKLLSLSKLQHSSVTMFYYDLVSGHRLVYGSESWLENCEHHRAAHRIPLHEATRLLFNRCSGLLFSQEKLTREQFTSEDADFVGRNLAKAKLAFGDVVLAMRNQYHWSCRERHKRLRKLQAEGSLQNFDWVLRFHEEGIDFKLHPVKNTSTRSDLGPRLQNLKECAAQLWLALESHRLGKKFSDLISYSFDRTSKCPETKPLRNCLINARQFGVPAALDTTYPRERLLASIPILLWHPDTISNPETLSFLQTQLRTSARTYGDLVSSYKVFWNTYN